LSGPTSDKSNLGDKKINAQTKVGLGCVFLATGVIMKALCAVVIWEPQKWVGVGSGYLLSGPTSDKSNLGDKKIKAETIGIGVGSLLTGVIMKAICGEIYAEPSCMDIGFCGHWGLLTCLGRPMSDCIRYASSEFFVIYLCI
jgi:hypothetical protein